MSLFPDLTQALITSPRQLAEMRFFGFICNGKEQGEIHCPCRARHTCVCSCHEKNGEIWPKSSKSPDDVEAALVAETEKVMADCERDFRAWGMLR